MASFRNVLKIIIISATLDPASGFSRESYIDTRPDLLGHIYELNMQPFGLPLENVKLYSVNI